MIIRAPVHARRFTLLKRFSLPCNFGLSSLDIGCGLFVFAVLICMSLKMANVWQKFVIPRMGQLQSVRGQGMFFITPLMDRIIAVIDGRIQTTAFNAEQALTAPPRP